jgi:hypothetical protein
MCVPHLDLNSLQDAQPGRPVRPQQGRSRRVPLRYVEAPSTARTKPAAFFSILLYLLVLVVWIGRLDSLADRVFFYAMVAGFRMKAS